MRESYWIHIDRSICIFSYIITCLCLASSFFHINSHGLTCTSVMKLRHFHINKAEVGMNSEVLGVLKGMFYQEIWQIIIKKYGKSLWDYVVILLLVNVLSKRNYERFVPNTD